MAHAQSGVQRRQTTGAVSTFTNGEGTVSGSADDLERQGSDGQLVKEEPDAEEDPKFKYAWHRFRGDGKKLPTVWQSLKHMFTHSILNVLFLFVPIAWAAHFAKRVVIEDGVEREEEVFSAYAQFALSFLAIIPLEKTFDWLGEQMAIYIGAELGELLEITLNNAVEVALAVFLLLKDRYRLLQATIVGVVLLHLLLVPGVSFLTGGARIVEQELLLGITELNHSLLTLGVMTLVLPAAFFAALNNGNLQDVTSRVVTLNQAAAGETIGDLPYSLNVVAGRVGWPALVSDERRGHFLSISRGLAVILIGVYVCSRFYLHNPPGRGNALQMHKNAPVSVQKRAKEKEEREPKVGPFAATIGIVVCVALMAVTAEWLVDSIETVQDKSNISQEFFGLFLLPTISFAADGLLAVIFFARKALFLPAAPPDSAASGLAIDLSIQFLLFWSPILVLVGWWSHKPLLLLFDFWEVAVLVAACFLVNYVTADAKTNWVEGVIMVSFYLMILITAWYYPGQIEIHDFVGRDTVALAVLNGPTFE